MRGSASTRRWWVVAVFLFVTLDAATMQSRGALLASFQEAFGATESLLGLVAPAGTAGMVVAVLAVGFVSGRIDIRRFMLAGVAITAAAVALMSVAPTYALLLAFFLVQSTATGVFRALDRPVLGHLYPGSRGRVFTLYSLAWAVGAVAGPLLVTGVIALADWRVTYAVLAVLFVPVVAVIWRVPTPEVVSSEEALSVADCLELLRRPSILGVAAAMLLVGGIEGAVFTWLPYYALEFTSRELANLMLSVYLLAYIPGRATYSVLAGRVPYLDLVAGLAVVCVPVFAFAFSGVGGLTLAVAVFVAGGLVSGLFPLISAYGIDAAPEYSGPVNAIATGATYLGIAVVPVVMGVIAEATDITVAMGVPVALTVVLVVVVALTRVLADP